MAVQLYDTVKDLPLIDWHNHLEIKDITKNKQYADLTELWITPDPYKHRAMRICGIPETLITGPASSYEKFQAWSRCLPELVGNPLYDWSHLELLRIFDIDEPLNLYTAGKIWEYANAQLKKKDCTARGLLARFNVEYVAPCIGLGDDLEDFADVKTAVPSLRGDTLFNLTDAVFSRTGTLAEFRIRLRQRLQEFHAAGCRFADHSFDCGFIYIPDDGKNEARFAALKRGTACEEDKIAISCEILRILGGLYAELGWILQLHIGALRQTSSRLRATAGPTGGYAGIGNSCDIGSLTRLLDDLEKSPSGLPQAILYTLNPADHAMLAVLSGAFPGGGKRGKVTLGPAWWYCDHINGMHDCLENVAAYGVLSVFPGMTTDSRSLLSFVRHEYFRRVLCSWLASKATLKEMPNDFDILRNLAKKICYFNAKAMIQ